MIFDKSIFTEQYHIGRPHGLYTFSCIGKFVPVIEYEVRAGASKFFEAHYEAMWDRAEDKTHEIIQRSLINRKETLISENA
ncbi:MAG: hypothetical protein GKS00_26785 [Alphaproteobacteria bacterium]|nr:hypothetical protein [Alphaproteobacteria bacterium]